MIKFSNWHGEEEEPSMLLDQDALGILSSTRTVVQQSRHVWINPERVEQLSKQWLNAFGGQQWGTFADLEQLTIFADYKLPQVLRHYHVLEYDLTLAQRIDNQELLPAESREEVEIRAVTLRACECLRRMMLQHGCVMAAAEIDRRLWLMGQQSTDMRPYHDTRMIYY